MQLVLVESAWLAFLAAAIGGLFAWWSAPFVVGRINPPDNPARLSLPADWRVLGFGLALTLGVTFLFGLAPALRASAVKPASALKGGEDPHSRRRLMHALIAVQVAFCFLVLFVAGLFAATFDRLSHQPIGFSAERLLTLDTVAAAPAAAGLLGPGGRTSARGAGRRERWRWPDGRCWAANGWNGFVSVNGAPPGDGPGLLSERLARLGGRHEDSASSTAETSAPSDTSPGVAIVNETFAKQYLRR